jgi:hypothetical protein
MAITQEMFRFVTTRRPERVLMSRIASRLMRDRRVATAASLLVKLFGPGLYDTKLVTANTFAVSAEFVAEDDVGMLALEPAVVFFRERLAADADLAEIAAAMQAELPLLTALLANAPPGALLEATQRMLGRLWDSLYAQTIRGCDRYVSTNYLVDGLRVYQVLRLLWLSRKLGLTAWAGGTFDEYEALIDLDRAMAAGDDGGREPGKRAPATLDDLASMRGLTQRLAELDRASQRIGGLLAASTIHVAQKGNGRRAFLDTDAVGLLGAEPALAKIDLAKTPVAKILESLERERQLATLERQNALARLDDPEGTTEYLRLANRALAVRKFDKTAPATMASLASPGSVFRVPLSVGAMRPPTVGDLILVEQELNRYELGELADIESIMRGERRERTIRSLARTSQTTTTESSLEQEESTSLKTDERFQLSTQAQTTANESFGVEMGVSVSGKFGPVQVAASVNASYDTSKSVSESTSQDYAKTVTEEATKRVKTSIKESSSITILTETQNTSLRGFNNEKGTVHVNGLYRWVDKIYTARLMNYGRRLMLSLAVPEPAAMYRGLLAQNEAALMADLVEPIHPSRISRTTNLPLPDTNTTGGYLSYEHITEGNYAELAALYDVAVQPPPPEYLTGSKAIAHPDAMQAAEIKEHDHVNDLSWVSGDNTLTLDPSYRLTEVVVYASQGATDGYRSYCDALKLGEDGDKIEDENILLVQVASKSFYLTARKDPNDGDKKLIKTNFNVWQTIDEDWHAFGELVQPAIPIAVTANFEGILTLTVAYKAYRLDETYAAWKSQTYAAILKGYTSKKQAYDQAIAAAKASARTGTEAQTFNLREDQYRAIELTELKRGCIDLLTEGSAAGYTSIAVAEDGSSSIVHDPAEGAALGNWRSPLSNGSVAEFFELAFEWENTTYRFYPYYWAGSQRWNELAQASGADPVFEQFLRAGSAGVVVPVRPGYERPVILFLKTGLVWGGGYLPLFTSQDMLEAYADVELGAQLDPPVPIGEPWEIRLPTSLVMLQQEETLPVFETEPTTDEPASEAPEEPEVDETVPF